MSRYLLDTNVISELRKGELANAGVRNWFATDDGKDGKELWLSVLVVGELRRGVELIARRDPTAGESIGAWLRELIDDFVDRILPVDVAVALTWATLGVPNPVPVIDGLLAATALTHDLTLVTGNERDFPSGVQLLNPFT